MRWSNEISFFNFGRTSISEVDTLWNWKHIMFVYAYAVRVPAMGNIDIQIPGV